MQVDTGLDRRGYQVAELVDERNQIEGKIYASVGARPLIRRPIERTHYVPPAGSMHGKRGGQAGFQCRCAPLVNRFDHVLTTRNNGLVIDVDRSKSAVVGKRRCALQ